LQSSLSFSVPFLSASLFNINFFRSFIVQNKDARYSLEYSNPTVIEYFFPSLGSFFFHPLSLQNLITCSIIEELNKAAYECAVGLLSR